jgi:hypothetical protein
VKIAFNRKVLLDFARTHYLDHEETETTWNARQIRNAFSTAISLGQSERMNRIRDENLSREEAISSGNEKLTTVRLTRRNFKSITETAKDFKEFISSIQGTNSSLALKSRLCNDRFGKPLTKYKKDYS